MAKQTENYNFNKPGQSDYYNIDDQNVNWDKADLKLKEIAEAIKPVSQGGTGATTVTEARSNLGLKDAATRGVDITPISGSVNLLTSGGVKEAFDKALKIDTTVTIAQGGTGATTAADARINLGLGAAAVKGVDATPSTGSENIPTSGGVRVALDSKAASVHTHDDRYYTETEISTFLALKANVASPSFTGTSTVAANTAYSTAMLRNIAFTSTDPGANSTSALPNGSILIVYE